MLALEILSLKTFMNHLLAADTFEPFLLVEATVSTASTYSMDGRINPDFFPPEERGKKHIPYDFRSWSEVKNLCFDLIKGKYTPLYFKFVLQLKPEHAQYILSGGSTDMSQVKALVLNIRYDGNKAVLTTGVSYCTFVMDKEAEHLWDTSLCKYLDNKEIGYEKL